MAAGAEGQEVKAANSNAIAMACSPRCTISLCSCSGWWAMTSAERRETRPDSTACLSSGAPLARTALARVTDRSETFISLAASALDVLVSNLAPIGARSVRVPAFMSAIFPATMARYASFRWRRCRFFDTTKARALRLSRPAPCASRATTALGLCGWDAAHHAPIVKPASCPRSGSWRIPVG